MIFEYMTTTLRFFLTVLTGKEYNRMARKSTTMMRMMSPMKRHLNLLHTMNFMVLHGLVNQKKDVSGRLMVMEMKDMSELITSFWQLRQMDKIHVRDLI